MSLSSEIRQRIYEEERFRLETQARIREEIRLRQQRTSLILRLFLMLVFFAVGILASEYFLQQSQAVPEAAVPVQSAALQVNQAVLDEIALSLKPQIEGEVCARTVDRPRTQIKATIELARDSTPEAVKRMAMAKVKIVGTTLRKHGFAIPAYVEVFSPQRWYGLALYDSDTLQIKWDACPGQCDKEGTQYVKRCRQ